MPVQPVPAWANEPFRLFAPSHLIWIALVVLIAAALFFWRSPTEAAKRRARLALLAILVLCEIGWNTVALVTGEGSIRTMLPLHLCTITSYLSMVMLLTKNRTIYEFCYFFGIGGATQALLTPEIPFAFPDIRFLLTFFGHGSMVIAALYMTLIEGYRPYWRSVIRVIAGLILFAVPVQLINLAIGSNYLFIAHKPYTPSPLDLMPAWPMYIPILGVLVIVVCLLLYLPFAIRDWRASQPARIRAKA